MTLLQQIAERAAIPWALEIVGCEEVVNCDATIIGAKLGDKVGGVGISAMDLFQNDAVGVENLLRYRFALLMKNWPQE